MRSKIKQFFNSNSLVIIGILLFYFFAVSRAQLFYDGPEYLRIVTTSSFISSLTLGHQPIHPLFIAPLWLFVRLCKFIAVPTEYSGNLFAFFCAGVSLILFNQIAKIYLSKKNTIWALVIFSLYSDVFIFSTNLMVESLLLSVFLLSIFFLSRFLLTKSPLLLRFYLLTIFLMPLIHLESLFWIPLVLVFPIIFPLKSKVDVKSLLLDTVLIVTASLGIYWLIFRLLHHDFYLLLGFAFSQYISSSVILILARSLRNIFLSFGAGFGYLSFPLTFIVMIKVIAKRRSKLAILVLIVCSTILATRWDGDLMIRRIVYFAPFLALMAVGWLKKKSWIYVVYLVPIFIANWLLYIRSSPLVAIGSQSHQVNPESILVQTHYLRPFTSCQGECFWIGQQDLGQIDKLIKGQNIYLDSQAVFAPYLLYVGDNYHITSLGQFGVSESQPLFAKYTFDLALVTDSERRIFLYQLRDKSLSLADRKRLNADFADKDSVILLGKAKPASSVLVYSHALSDVMHRARIDYGDLSVWLWFALLKKREPLGWTYADREGVFIYPVSRQKLGDVYLKGEIVNWSILDNSSERLVRN